MIHEKMFVYVLEAQLINRYPDDVIWSPWMVLDAFHNTQAKHVAINYLKKCIKRKQFGDPWFREGKFHKRWRIRKYNLTLAMKKCSRLFTKDDLGLS